MGNNQTKRRIVELNNVRKNSIVVVDLNQSITGSVFAQEYEKTVRVIRRIIHENTDYLASNPSSCTACRNRNCSTCKNRDRHRYNLKEFHTAVPFIGNRGTGKSSIMCSVLEYLNSYRGDRAEGALKLSIPQQSPRFITFDMIDANTLNSTEDVMEIILSRMLTYLEDLHCPEDDFRELYRMIDELHQDLSLVYWKEEDRQEYGLTGLQRIADSQKSIERFRKLVERFNNDVSRFHFDRKPCYLVIALDDIDMYQGGKNGMADSQFALLDHVYNHMRIPGLIVLMTFNEHMLRRRCNAHFARIYFGRHKPDHQITTSQQRDIDELTAQFMSKLFPQERRIYMPNYQYVDSGNESNLYVSPVLHKETSSQETGILLPFTSEKALPVKAFMLRLIAHKTGVYFDAAGTKQHFFEPRNLRELGELYEVIDSMENFPEKCTKEVKESIQESNRQELLNYLYNQFALKRLASGEYREFNTLSMLPIVRQGRTLVDHIRDQRRKHVMRGHLGYLDVTTQDRWRYSYGELLRNIYYSTRITTDTALPKTIYTKEFIRCILGTHSVLLNQIIHNTSDSTNDASASAYESHMQMLNVIGSSIAGRWANAMLPKFKIEGFDPRPGGSLSLPIRHFFDWCIPYNVTEALVNLSRDNSKYNQQVICQFLKAFLLVGMCFTGFPVNGLKIELQADLDDTNAAALFLSSSSEDHICFNAMNFVLNLYDAFDIAGSSGTHQGYLSRMVLKLEKLGKNLVREFSREWNREISNAELLREKYISEHSTDPYFSPNNDPTVKAYTQAITRAIEWEQILVDAQFDGTAFLKRWNALVDKLVSEFRAELIGWRNAYGHQAAVLPVQHFDMMYNIIKRLANVSYHDIPDEAPIEDIVTHYAQLYKSVAKELASQDRTYLGAAGWNFSDAFQNCIFYKNFTAPEEMRNPFLSSFLVNMLSNAITAKARRNKVSDLSLSDFA